MIVFFHRHPEFTYIDLTKNVSYIEVDTFKVQLYKFSSVNILFFIQ